MAVDARFINLDDGTGQDIFEFSNDDGTSVIRLGRVGGTNDMEFVIVRNGVEHRVVAQNAIVEGEYATWRVGVDPDGVMRLGKDTNLLAEGEGVVPDDVARSNRLIGQSLHDSSDIGMSGTVVNLRIANYGDLEDLDPEQIGSPCAVTGEAQCFCSAIAPNALVELGLIGETEFSDVDPEGDGEWSQIQSFGVIPIHALVLPDGKVLSFGTDERGLQGAQYVYSLYDPETGVDIILPQTTDTDIFCSTMSLDPTTGNVIIMGGDARGEGGPVNGAVNDVVIFDYTTQTIRDATQGEMAFDRWYGSSVTLPNGEILVLGGRGGGDDRPEVFNSSSGWRELDNTNINVGETYPKTFVASDGSVVTFSGEGTIYRIWTDGDGQSQAVGTVDVPHRDDSPGIMYDVDKIAIVGQDGDLYTADISESTVSFTKVADLQGARREGGMSLMADGRVLIAGGTTGSRSIADSNTNIEIWDPQTNSIELLDGQQLARLYHSSYQLMPNGTVWVGGGGAPGPLTNTNVEFYAPDYLYGPDGEFADRPEITSAPANVGNNETFRFNVDDASQIDQVTAIRPGSSTHATNMDARFISLDFTVIDSTTIEVTTLGSGAMVPGSYMMFVVDDDGVPSEASMLGVSMVDLVETANLTPADAGQEIYAIDDDPINGAFEVNVEARFDDVGGREWQRVFDFGNGPGQDNVLLTQVENSNDIRFTVFTANDRFDLIAENAIQEGETAKWTVSVGEDGYTRMWKNDVLVAEGQGIVPDDVERSSRLVGESNWDNDDSLLGMVRLLEIVNAGDSPEYVHQSLPSLTLIAPEDVAEGAAGESGTLLFEIQLDRPAVSAVTADVNISGDVAGPSQINIPVGATSAVIELSFQGDDVFEASENISVSLSNVNGARLGGSQAASATIVDDDLSGSFLTARHYAVSSNIDSVNDINLNANPLFEESVSEIGEDAGRGNFYAGGRSDDFGVVYTGGFSVDTAGSYTFYLGSDDGSVLYIDGQPVINNDGLHATQEKTATVTLSAGSHQIEVRYFERGGYADIFLDWSSDQFGRRRMSFDGT